MKRLIYLFLILTCLFISGCDEPDTPTPDDEKYYAVSFDTGINYIIETKNVKEGSLLEEPTDVLIKEEHSRLEGSPERWRFNGIRGI